MPELNRSKARWIGDDGGALVTRSRNPLHLWPAQFINAGRAWNRVHVAEAAEFERLTGIDSQAIRVVRKWQLDHGVPGNGKIDSDTLRAARRVAGGEGG